MKELIDKVVEAIEMADDSTEGFYNRETGEIAWLYEFMDSTEREKTVEMIDGWDFIRLPTKYDIHEYSIMENFIDELPHDRIKNELARAIHGRGAFRRFKDIVNYYGIADKWYAYRNNAYRNIAIEWCRDNNVINDMEDLIMERVCKFLKDAKTYYLATVDGDKPKVRPFGTAHIFDGKLYIQTGKKKAVSEQIKKNPNVEICAMNGEDWLRVSGQLAEDDRRAARVSMLEAYPALKALYDPDDGNTQVFYFKNAKAVFSSFTKPEETVEF